MQARPSEEEWLLYETLSNPVGFSECLFSDVDNLSRFDENCISLRIYQYAFLSYEFALSYNYELTAKENFLLRKVVGESYNYSGRRIGKTVVNSELDMLYYVWWAESETCGFSAYDQAHLSRPFEVVLSCMEGHPILSQVLGNKKTRAPYVFNTVNGVTVYGVNTNKFGRAPGNQFVGHHFHRIYIEESSYEDDNIKEKRSDSISDFGAIIRASGMTNFTKHTPAGKIFYDSSLKKYVINYPQYISPEWDEEELKRAINEYSGRDTVPFKCFVDAQVTEDGISVFDIERVRKCWNMEKMVKAYEVTKENFHNFKDILSILECPKNVELVHVDSDIGENETEIIVLFKVNERYVYTYNIRLNNLITKQLIEVFSYILQKVNFNYCYCDASIDANEFVLANYNNTIKYIRVKELFDIFDENKDTLTCPTYENGKLVWKKCTLFRHQKKGKMYKVQCQPGSYNIKVTNGHSMMVYTEEGLKEKKVDELKLGDYMLSAKNFNYEGKKTYLKFLDKKINLDKELAYFLGWCCAEGSSKTTNYQATLGDEKVYADQLLDICKRKFAFDGGYIQKVTKENINARKRVQDPKATKDRYSVIFGGGKRFLHFMEDLLGSGAANKKVPEVIFNSKKDIQESFLKGVLDGDGSERKDGTEIDWVHTISEELAAGIVFLLQNLGKYPRYYEIKGGVDKRGINSQNSYIVSTTCSSVIGKWEGIPISCIPDDKCPLYLKRHKKDRKLWSKHNKTLYNKIKEHFPSDWHFKKIKKIESYDFDDYVYDLCVEDNHTFVAGKGNILTHNTEGIGRTVVRALQDKFGNDRCFGVHFNKKIAVDFERDDKDEVVFDKDGVPQYREEYVAEWSVLRLKHLFYNQTFGGGFQHKLDKQVNSVICMQQSMRRVYKIPTGEDHLFQAFQVAGIALWEQEFNINKPLSKKKFGKIGA